MIGAYPRKRHNEDARLRQVRSSKLCCASFRMISTSSKPTVEGSEWCDIEERAPSPHPPSPHTLRTHNHNHGHQSRSLFRAERWDAWLEEDLEGAQAVVRCACAASEPAFAEELISKAGFACGSGEGGGGELEGVSFVDRRTARAASGSCIPSTYDIRFVSTGTSLSSCRSRLPLPHFATEPPPPPLRKETALVSALDADASVSCSLGFVLSCRVLSCRVLSADVK